MSLNSLQLSWLAESATLPQEIFYNNGVNMIQSFDCQKKIAVQGKSTSSLIFRFISPCLLLFVFQAGFPMRRERLISNLNSTIFMTQEFFFGFFKRSQISEPHVTECTNNYDIT